MSCERESLFTIVTVLPRATRMAMGLTTPALEIVMVFVSTGVPPPDVGGVGEVGEESDPPPHDTATINTTIAHAAAAIIFLTIHCIASCRTLPRGNSSARRYVQVSGPSSIGATAGGKACHRTTSEVSLNQHVAEASTRARLFQ
jgi:hypothetical protein